LQRGSNLFASIQHFSFVGEWLVLVVLSTVDVVPLRLMWSLAARGSRAG
jgi:hypothetical protein